MSDIESLLDPISDDQPAGPDLRLDPGDLTFQTLKELSTSVDAALAETEDEAREANWPGVVGLCVSALQEKAKDLELIAALAEAWVRTEGIPGLEQGVELLHRSVETYWDTLHPGVDPDDGEIALALRARWLNWMDSAKGFIQAVKRGPIVRAQGGIEYSWLDHENSALLDDATVSPERHQELVDAGVVSSGQWQATLRATDADAIRSDITALQHSSDTLRALGELCRERFEAEDEEPPDFYNLINLLDEIREYLAQQVGTDESAGEFDPQVGAGGQTGGGAGAGQPRGPIDSRQEALRQLQQVGDYFRHSEPHSPISYLVARAVKWGSMPLDQLLKDVVRSDDVIGHIWETLGLDGRDGPGGEDDEDEY